MFKIYHPPCPSEAGKRASLTPHSVLSISAHLIKSPGGPLISKSCIHLCSPDSCFIPNLRAFCAKKWPFYIEMPVKWPLNSDLSLRASNTPFSEILWTHVYLEIGQAVPPGQTRPVLDRHPVLWRATISTDDIEEKTANAQKPFVLYMYEIQLDWAN